MVVLLFRFSFSYVYDLMRSCDCFGIRSKFVFDVRTSHVCCNANKSKLARSFLCVALAQEFISHVEVKVVSLMLLPFSDGFDVPDVQYLVQSVWRGLRSFFSFFKPL